MIYMDIISFGIGYPLDRLDFGLLAFWRLFGSSAEIPQHQFLGHASTTDDYRYAL